MPRVLITGANGHIGANTVRSLLRRGHEVIPFVRPTSDLRGVQGLGLDFRHGDVMDGDSLAAAAEGCDVIVHTAAVYRTWTTDPAEVLEPALVGTRNLFEAARAVGVSRVVYTSSVAAVGAGAHPDDLRSEADWHEDARNPYYVAKTESEREAWHLSEAYGIPMIALCPAMVLGLYDYRITPSTEIILALINGTRTTWNGGFSLVDVRDVAAVHAAAVDGGELGQRYIIGGTNLTVQEIGKLIQQFTGVSPIHLGFGRRFSLLVAGAAGLWGRLTGSKPPFSHSEAYEVVERYSFYDCALTNQVFGLMPRGAQEVVCDCIRWLLYIGRIKPTVARHLAGRFAPDPEWLRTQPGRGGDGEEREVP
jgi:dihydroflavonol-4-reductase